MYDLLKACDGCLYFVGYEIESDNLRLDQIGVEQLKEPNSTKKLNVINLSTIP